MSGAGRDLSATPARPRAGARAAAQFGERQLRAGRIEEDRAIGGICAHKPHVWKDLEHRIAVRGEWIFELWLGTTRLARSSDLLNILSVMTHFPPWEVLDPLLVHRTRRPKGPLLREF